jgi:hypothetical protein
MATQTHQSERRQTKTHAARGAGWVVFASAYLSLAGILNVIYGIATLENKQYFHESGLLWSNLNTWGWVAIIVGALQLGIAGFLWARSAFGVVLGIFVAMLAFIANFLSIGAYPVWSVIAMVLDGFVIWALSTNLMDPNR